MRKVILVLLVSFSLCAKAQVKDTVHVADTIPVFSVHDMDIFLKSLGSKISHDDWVNAQSLFVLFIQQNDDKRKVKKHK